jgi:hypothetical protein
MGVLFTTHPVQQDIHRLKRLPLLSRELQLLTLKRQKERVSIIQRQLVRLANEIRETRTLNIGGRRQSAKAIYELLDHRSCARVPAATAND